MNLQEIKQAISEGKTVHWENQLYEVVLDKLGQYLIKCKMNGHCIGLTWADGTTMNGEEKQFYIA
jgi:hypothetical protein